LVNSPDAARVLTNHRCLRLARERLLELRHVRDDAVDAVLRRDRYSALAAFSNQTRPRGYQQFEAVGYQVGADGKRYTADDVELGPVDVAWSTKVFYTGEGSSADFVGSVSPTGLYTPADKSPENNFDVWAIATAKNEKDKNGKPLVGKSYLVVTVPMYTFNGRRYVRDLDRWIDDGPAQVTQRGKQ
jgi:hypothetical protein